MRNAIGRQWLVFLIVLLAGAGAIAFAWRLLPVVHEATARVALVARLVGGGPAVGIADVPVLALSPNELERVHSALQLPYPAEGLPGLVNARAISENTVEISARDADPARAMAIANRLARDIVERFADISSAGYVRPIDEISRAIDREHHRIAAINADLRRVRGTDSDAAADAAFAAATKTVEGLEAQRAAALLEATDAKAAAPVARAAPAATHPPQPQPQRDTVAQPLADRPPAQRGDRFPGLADTAPATPVAPATATAQATVAPVAQDDASLANATQSLAAASDALGPARLQLRRLSAARANAAALLAQRDAARATYAALIARRDAGVATRAQALSRSSLRIVNLATTTRPRLELQSYALLGLAALAALAFAVAAAALASRLDPRLQRSEDIEALYARPIIATIASGDVASGTTLANVQSLRLMLEVRVAAPAIIAVASAAHGDGEALAAFALADGLAAAQRRTLLLRNDSGGTKAHAFDRTHAGVEPVLRHLGVNGLFVIDASEAGMGRDATRESVAMLMQRLRSQYDYVVVDTSAFADRERAIAGAADADVTLIAVRHGRRRGPNDDRLAHAIESTPLNVVGVVDVSPRAIAQFRANGALRTTVNRRTPNLRDVAG